MKKIVIILLFFFIIFSLIGILAFGNMLFALISYSQENQDIEYIDNINLSKEVLKYKEQILNKMIELNIDEKYLYVILAQVQQESSGVGIDIFQCSESKYGYIGGIKTTDESIEQGLKVWKRLLNLFEKNNIKIDIPALLQTYNFGDGYFYYLKNNNLKHSQKTSEMFSSLQAQKLGWAKYGDTNYSKNVLRYVKSEIIVNNYINGIFDDDILGKPLNLKIDNSGSNQVSSFYGKRDIWVKGVHISNHNGIDLTAVTGTPIYATSSGYAKVRYFGGYGNCIDISNSTYTTRYAHLSRFNIKPGIFVKKGELIGYVGSTGNSTGPHLHYEVYKKGKRYNPLLFIPKDQFNSYYYNNTLLKYIDYLKGN